MISSARQSTSSSRSADLALDVQEAQQATQARCSDFAEPTLERRASRSTNALTAAASSSASASAPCVRSRSVKSSRATLT
jgi:hypothetical protein